MFQLGFAGGLNYLIVSYSKLHSEVEVTELICLSVLRPSSQKVREHLQPCLFAGVLGLIQYALLLRSLLYKQILHNHKQ